MPPCGGWHLLALGQAWVGTGVAGLLVVVGGLIAALVLLFCYAGRGRG
jgi:hypothetical protein